MSRLDFIKDLSKGDKLDFEFPFLMLYLRALTSETMQRMEMIRTASEKSIFPTIGWYLNKVLYLSKQWRYPQAVSTMIMGEQAPAYDFKQFLFKLSQSIGSGEPINDFVERSYKTYFAQYLAVRQQALHRLKTLSDSYLPLMSVTLFMSTTMLTSSIFYDANIMITLTIVTVVVVSFLLYIISFLIFQAARPEEVLISGQPEKPVERQRWERLALICLGIALIIIPLPIEPFLLRAGIGGLFLLIGGYFGRRYVNKVKSYEDAYPHFMRYMSSNMSVSIPLVEVMRAATDVDFGQLNEPIKALYNKLQMRVEPKTAWWSFETELDSLLIRRVNLIMTETIATGGNLSRSGKFMEEFYHEYTTLRRTRYTAVSYHTGIMVPLYAVMAALFGILDGFFASLNQFLAKITSYVSFLQPPDLDFMRFFFTFALCLFALNNVYSLYNMEGDSRFSVLYLLGLQLLVGGVLFTATSSAVLGILGGVTTI